MLKWAHDRAAPLAFIGLSIATLLWLDFIKTNDIPVSFFSSSLIAGLPALFATVTFVVMVLTLNAVMPAFVLWIPLYKGGPALSASASEFPPESAEATKIAAARGSFINRWLLTVVLIGVAWIGWIFLLSTHPKIQLWWSLPVLFLGSAVPALCLFWRPLKVIARRRPSFEFLYQLTMSIALQNTVAFSVLYVALQSASNGSELALAIRLVICTLTLVIIGAGQFIAAKRVARCNDPLKSCSGVTFPREDPHEHRDGRRNQTLDRPSEVGVGP